MAVYREKFSRVQGGFTLVELIVATFVFSIVMVIAVGGLVTMINADRKSQNTKSVMNNLNFSLDSMTRAIRTGTKYQNVNAASSFTFTDSDDVEVTYELFAGQIYRTIGADSIAVTAPEVSIEKLEFTSEGTSGSDETQPRLLIIVQGIAGTSTAQTDFSLETMVTQRLIDR